MRRFLQIKLSTILWIIAVGSGFLAGRISTASKIKALEIKGANLEHRAVAAEGFLSKMREDFKRALGPGNPTEIYYFDVGSMPHEVP